LVAWCGNTVERRRECEPDAESVTKPISDCDANTRSNARKSSTQKSREAIQTQAGLEKDKGNF
jgi:hypothetical protein